MSTTETYTLSGATDFTFSHPVRLASQLTVEVVPGGVVSSSDYEVIGAGPAATGVTVRYPDAPTDGTKTLKISRYIEPTRVSDFTGAAGITVTGLEAEFDNVYRSIEDLQTAEGVSAPVVAATTANITLSGEQTIDGVSVVEDDRVLVKEQTDDTENGVWICQTDAWYRATDWDQDGEVLNGTLVVDTNQGAVFRASFSGSYDPGTTSVSFESFSVVADGSITTAKLADDAVTNAKVAAGAIDTAELADDSVTNAKVAAGAIDTAELANSAVTTPKIDNDSITDAKLANSVYASQAEAEAGTNSSKLMTPERTQEWGDENALLRSASSSDPGLAFDTWRTPSATRPTAVWLSVTVQSSSSADGQVDVEVDESGGTTADYSLVAGFAADVTTVVVTAKESSCFILPAGASYRVVNTADPNSGNTIDAHREFTL